MGQKVHPVGFRLGFTKGWNSSWYNSLNTKNYANMLIDDFKIQEYIKGSLYKSKKYADLINIYRNYLGTYIYFGSFKRMFKKNKYRVTSTLRNRRLYILALRLDKQKSKIYLNKLKKNKYAALTTLQKKKKKLYKNYLNPYLKSYIIQKKRILENEISKGFNKLESTGKIKDNRATFLLNSLDDILNNININGEIHIDKINEILYQLKTKNIIINKNLLATLNKIKNYGNKFKNYNRKFKRFKKRPFLVFRDRKKFGKKKFLYSPLINLLKIKNKLNLITYSKIFLYLYSIRKFKGLPYNNVSLIATLLARTFKIHTKLFAKIYKKYNYIFKKIYPKFIKGVRIKYSGKTWGKGRTKTHLFNIGKMPLNNTNELIDYSFAKAQNRFGVIGIKIWINHYHKGKNLKQIYLRSQERKLLNRWPYNYSALQVQEYLKKTRKYSHNLFNTENHLAIKLKKLSLLKLIFRKQKFYNYFHKRKNYIKNKYFNFYSNKLFNLIKLFKINVKSNNNFNDKLNNKLLYSSVKSIYKVDNKHNIKLLHGPMIQKRYYHNNIISKNNNNFIKLNNKNNRIYIKKLLKDSNDNFFKFYNNLPKIRNKYKSYYKSLQHYSQLKNQIHGYNQYDIYNKLAKFNDWRKVFPNESLNIKKYYSLFPYQINEYIFNKTVQYDKIQFINQRSSSYNSFLECHYDFRPFIFRKYKKIFVAKNFKILRLAYKVKYIPSAPKKAINLNFKYIRDKYFELDRLYRVYGLDSYTNRLFTNFKYHESFPLFYTLFFQNKIEYLYNYYLNYYNNTIKNLKSNNNSISNKYYGLHSINIKIKDISGIDLLSDILNKNYNNFKNNLSSSNESKFIKKYSIIKNKINFKEDNFISNEDYIKNKSFINKYNLNNYNQLRSNKVYDYNYKIK